jgi:predicted PurR-regulated permease PerM
MEWRAEMESRLRNTQFVKRALLLAGLVLIIVYFSQVMKAAKAVYGICLPLILGFVIAYVVNILMRFLERHYFPRCQTAHGLQNKEAGLSAPLLCFDSA